MHEYKPSHCGNIDKSREQTKKSTASSRVSEPARWCATRQQGEMQGRNWQPTSYDSAQRAKHLSACLAPLFCRISRSCAGAYAAKVLVLRLRLRWIIHPEGFISPLK